jgi:subfamily B ATP-binding cassette protein HlyB/CyaB
MLQPALKGEEVGGGISAEHFVRVLGSLCRIHRVPFDAALLLQQFPPPYARHNLIEAARALGFKAGELALSDSKLREAPLPLVAFMSEKGSGATDEPPCRAEPGAANPSPGRAEPGAANPPRAPVPALILKQDGERFLYVVAGSDVPNARRAADLAQRHTTEQRVGRERRHHTERNDEREEDVHHPAEDARRPSGGEPARHRQDRGGAAAYAVLRSRLFRPRDW